MKKAANILFLIVGVILPILIGALHTEAHFQTLTSPLLKEMLQGTFILFDQEEILYQTWGIMSFMMGIAFMIIGMLNAHTYHQVRTGKAKLTIPLLIMITYLGCVIYAGHEFQQFPQFYGGIIGLILALISVGLYSFSMSNSQAS
ncbi:MAG: hypothetical protein AAF824_10205 [Bacteroidota bacterium]